MCLKFFLKISTFVAPVKLKDNLVIQNKSVVFAKNKVIDFINE